MEKDESVAAIWYRKAAEQGDCVSQFNLGTSLIKGDGVVKDFVEVYRCGVGKAGCVGGADRHGGAAGECQLRGQKQFALELPRIGANVASKLKEPNTKDEPFEDVVKSAQDAAVLVLVY